MSFDQWLLSFKPVDFSFTVLVYLFVVSVIAVLWFKIIPWYIKEERPFQREQRAKRVQAEIELKRDELAEQRLMRQALERIGSVSDKISLMLELHDKTARAGIDQILSLLRIVLEKQGVSAAEIAKFLAEPADPNSAALAALRQLFDPQAKPPAAVAQ